MLFRTTKDDGHWHLGYADPQGALTSAHTDGHRHMVQVLPGQPPVLLPWTDPETGEEHSHVISPDVVGAEANKPKVRTSETEKAKTMTEVLELYRIAEENDGPSLEEAETASDYADGNQWEDADRQALIDAGRPCLTLNMVEPMLDLLSGYSRQNRLDWKWFPVEGSDNGTADLFNMASKHIAKRSNVESEEIDVSDEQQKIGRSFFEVVPDFTRNPLGEVRVSHFPNANVRCLPHRKKDLSDCDGIFKIQKISLADAKTRFPEFGDKFEKVMQTEPETTMPPVEKLIESADGYGATTDTYFVDPALYNDTVVDTGNKTVTVLEFERREYRVVHLVIIPSEGKAIEVTAEEQRKAETLDPLVTTFDTQQAQIRVILSAGPFVIKDGYPWRPFKDRYSLVAVYAKKSDKTYWGKVKGVIDCQDEINKRHSQTADLVNKTGYGWFYDDNTFESKKDAQEFDAKVSTPMFRLRLADVTRPPVKVEGTRVPQEVVQLEQSSIQMFYMISNVNAPALGRATSQESGRSQQIQIRQAMVGNEYLFDNFVLAKREVGRLAMGWAKKIYTPDRMARLVIAGAGVAAKEGSQVQLGQNQMPEQMGDEEKAYWMGEIAKMWANADIMEYDLEVGEGALSPTARAAARTELTEAASHGVMIPGELVLELSDLPEHIKRKYMKMAAAMQQQQAEIENRKIDAEIQKARGGAPDAALPPKAPAPQIPPPPQPLPPGM